MKVLYQADNDLRKAIVRGAVRREPRVNFRSAQAAHLDGVPDPEVLAFAAVEGRILVSHDFQTMPKYFRQGHTGPTQHGSIVDQARPAGRRSNRDSTADLGGFRSGRVGKTSG